MFACEAIGVGTPIVEFESELISVAESNRWEDEYERRGRREEFMLGIDSAAVVIDVNVYGNHAR